MEAGQADRQAWEAWFNAQIGEFRAGAEYWAAHRSEPSPTCAVPARSVRPDWSAGCRAAAERLAPPDRRRITERDYRAGWNDPVSTRAAAPAPRVPARISPGASFRPGETIVQEIVRHPEAGGAPDRETSGGSAATLAWTVTSFAADAHDCIMVRVQTDLPNTSSWREACAPMAAPLGSLDV